MYLTSPPIKPLHCFCIQLIACLWRAKKSNISEWAVVTIIALRFFFRTSFAYISDFARNLNHTASTKQFHDASGVIFNWIMTNRYDNDDDSNDNHDDNDDKREQKKARKQRGICHDDKKSYDDGDGDDDDSNDDNDSNDDDVYRE